MTVLQFVPRLALASRFSATLTNGVERRRYEVIPLKDGWQTWVRLNGRPHTAAIVTLPNDALRIRRAFDREIAQLLAEGWRYE